MLSLRVLFCPFDRLCGFRVPVHWQSILFSGLFQSDFYTFVFFEISQDVRWAFLCFYVADLAFAIGRCADPGLVNVLIKFSQWRGPQTFAIMKESIVDYDVNSVLSCCEGRNCCRRSFSLPFRTILVRFG